MSKKAWQTTEFWGNIFGAVAPIANAAIGNPVPIEAVLTMGGMLLGNGAMRTQQKKNDMLMQVQMEQARRAAIPVEYPNRKEIYSTPNFVPKTDDGKGAGYRLMEDENNREDNPYRVVEVNSPSEQQAYRHPQVIKTIKDYPLRGVDAHGDGSFGSSRSNGRTHKGIDLMTEPHIETPGLHDGTITNIGFPYNGDMFYRYVEVTHPTGAKYRCHYVNPIHRLSTQVKKGQSIGFAQNISEKYSSPGKVMKNHLHLECYNPQGQIIDPREYFAAYCN